MLNIGICDDEKTACLELNRMIYQYASDRNIKVDVSTWYTGESLCHFLEDNEKLDLIFLDIELISTDGIEIGNYIRNELENMEVDIIYISSHSSYAMRLFRVQPVDFLIKPFRTEAFEDAMNHFMKCYARKNNIFEYTTKQRQLRIPYCEILYFYSENKKVVIVTKNGVECFHAKLKEIEPMLSHSFIQIHQSYLINMDYLQELKYETVKMCNGDVLTISQAYRKKVRTQIMRTKWDRK